MYFICLPGVQLQMKSLQEEVVIRFLSCKVHFRLLFCCYLFFEEERTFRLKWITLEKDYF